MFESFNSTDWNHGHLTREICHTQGRKSWKVCWTIVWRCKWWIIMLKVIIDWAHIIILLWTFIQCSVFSDHSCFHYFWNEDLRCCSWWFWCICDCGACHWFAGENGLLQWLQECVGHLGSTIQILLLFLCMFRLSMSIYICKLTMPCGLSLVLF